ncbi:roadblock/LC7 domain-containing protein [Natronosporangium hydrolyticum]|uniref:Roadblock/LC7 domain-containing protein n=1 Tax=Natronosporangium hydrolyticum TaxID=2811111 RepID=A0A895YJU9_9ACTN|nr:roadblock/LC7 domain-containing protein [Natronosporangium hydrolyticum]QSB15789.1 roadblock/LC7 domain-containing protein [Natronosporangium hydrolyticum]
MAQSPAKDLAWLLDDLTGRVAEVERAIVLSNDGLLIAASRNVSQEDAEHLSAAASGFQSLARGTGRCIGGGAVRQTVVEFERSFFFVTAAGSGASLAVQATAEADVGVVAYEMAKLVTGVGRYLSTGVRVPPFASETMVN